MATDERNSMKRIEKQIKEARRELALVAWAFRPGKLRQINEILDAAERQAETDDATALIEEARDLIGLS